MKTSGYRIISFIAAAVFCAVIFGSAVFVAVHSEHNCTGSGCDICEMIKQCEKTIGTAGIGVLPDNGCFFSPGIMLAAVLFTAASISKYTLISMKVELLD